QRKSENSLMGPATKMSCLPSPLKSATANWFAVSVADGFQDGPAVKVPSPFPSKTVPSKKRRSILPSPFRSALSACPLPGKVGGVKNGFVACPNVIDESRNARKVKRTQACISGRRKVGPMNLLQ